MQSVLYTAAVVSAGSHPDCRLRLWVYRGRERKWIAASFSMHVGFACVQVPLTQTFFGGGDMFRYMTYGEILARMMERDPLHVVPEVTAAPLHGEPNLHLY